MYDGYNELAAMKGMRSIGRFVYVYVYMWYPSSGNRFGCRRRLTRAGRTAME